MKRYLITSIIAFAMLSLCGSITAAAQEYDQTPVAISKEKIRIDGQVCYSHIVLEKQTLYSISKAYNVSIEELYRYNPSLKENGLKKNSILIIPIIESAPKEEAKAEIAEEKVLQKQLEKDKPSLVKRKTHVAKWYEDLETIAAKYGIGVNALMRANNMTNRKLAKRQKLIIPNPGEFPDEIIVAAEPEVPAADSLAFAADSTAGNESHRLFPDFYFPKKEISMSLLMPLKADGVSSSRQNMDFYSGVLLAIYDMQKEGISTELNVYDIADGKIPAGKRDIAHSDIVIGPVASGDISRSLESIPAIHALVSPLDPRAEKLAYESRAMIQAPTPHIVQYNDLISWIKEDLQTDDRVLFISEKGARPSEAILNMTAAIDSSGIEYQPLSYSILEGRDITETLAFLMTETAVNRVYIASESEAFVNDVVRNLNVMIHQKYNVVLYAPSKIRSFETIEAENFHNTSMHVSTGYHIDYNDPRVMKFLLEYRALFNTEPTQFAYQGYDLAKYFIGLCSKYGNRWTEKLDSSPASMLQSSFNFKSTTAGGHINNGVRRLIYGPNWTIEKIR